MAHPTQPALDREGLIEALDLTLPRPRLSFYYRAGILLVGAVMVLLPLVYVTLVGSLGYGLYYHAVENVSLLTDGGSARVRSALYLAPLVIGSILLFFMLKPLLAPRRRRDLTVEVSRSDEPLLYEFVDQVCATVGAPAPRRILVDCRVNASAGFHQGGTGVLRHGRELVLGLPLVAAMPLRQVTGILAHEFGHFSQGAAMRLSFVVETVNAWFSRVVFERDRWDEKLEEMRQKTDGFLGLLPHIATGFVWCTRKLLFGLMWVGHAVSCYLSRHMEYDADRYAIGFVGSKAFSDAMIELSALNMALDRAFDIIQDQWREGRLPDDIPALAMDRYHARPQGLHERIRASLANQKAHLFATHPRVVDRLAAAERLGEAGRFQIDAPATDLFQDFSELCRRATTARHQEALGSAFESAQLVPNREILNENSSTDQGPQVAEPQVAVEAGPTQTA